MDDIEKKARELLRDAGEESPGCALVDGDAAIRAIVAALRATPEQRAVPPEQRGAGDACRHIEALEAATHWSSTSRKFKAALLAPSAPEVP